MNTIIHSIIIVIFFFFSGALHSANEIRLTLEEPFNGHKYLEGEKVDFSPSNVVLKIDGEIKSIKRENINGIKFLPDPKPGDIKATAANAATARESRNTHAKPKQPTNKEGNPTTPESSEPNDIRLTLKEPDNGQKYLAGEMMDLSQSHVVLKTNGKTKSVNREDIDTIQFIPQPGPKVAQTSVPNTEAPKVPEGPEAKQSASANRGSTPDLTELDKPENRAKFRRIQSTMMARYKGTPIYSTSIKNQNRLYEKLASGQMSLEQLQEMAGAHARKFENSNKPEIKGVVKQLKLFTEGEKVSMP